MVAFKATGFHFSNQKCLYSTWQCTAIFLTANLAIDVHSVNTVQENTVSINVNAVKGISQTTGWNVLNTLGCGLWYECNEEPAIPENIHTDDRNSGMFLLH